MDKLVQGDEIAFEGVEASEPPALADALQRAVDATNQASAVAHTPAADAAQQDTHSVAEQIAPEPRTTLDGIWAAAYTDAKTNLSQWFG